MLDDQTKADDPIARLARLSGTDIFERRHPQLGGYRFVMPSVMISADDVVEEIHGQLWHLSHTVDGNTYRGVAEDRMGAYLALIGDRMGLVVTTASKPEDET